MATGNRCVIYDDIDALSEARTVADLVRRLKPILSELAYYGVTGETAVLEAHEEWRSQYTDRLRDETPPAASSGAATRSEPMAAPMESRSATKQSARPPSREQFSTGGHASSRPTAASSTGGHASSRPTAASGAGGHASSRPTAASGRTAAGVRTSGTQQRSMQNEDSDPMPMRANSGIYTPGRVNSTGVPRALLAIMSGTHPSLKD